MAEYVTLRELAEQLGMDRSHLRKYILKHGFEPVRIRTKASLHQLTLALSEAEAERVRQLRRSQGFGDALGTPARAE
jgi:hypothetical protein